MAKGIKSTSTGSANPMGDEYLKAYPSETTFYRTSDGQWFLQADKQWAEEHQKTLKQGELETINR